MELYLGRQEIRRQVRAILGRATDDTLAAQTLAQENAFVDMGAVQVQQDRHGGPLERRTTFNLGAEQNEIAYPSSCGAGGILELAVYDADAGQYYAVKPRVIPVAADQDQEQIAGGDTFTAVQGRPLYYQQLTLLRLHPYSDKAYKLRARHLLRVTFTDEITASVVDAQAIIYFAAAMSWDALGERGSFDTYMGLYQSRIRQLMAWQTTGDAVAIANDASFDEVDEAMAQLPNWDTGPTIR